MSASTQTPPITANPGRPGPPPPWDGAVARFRRVAERAKVVPEPVAVAVGLLAIVAISAWLRSTALHAGFWIDEGLSVGIASHRVVDIPSVLRQDGSPPLYYTLLGLWIRLWDNDGQAATHMLSLVFALAAVPAAFWAGRSLFGRRAGWYAAALFAVNPFLTYYAQETRMYALVVLLSLTTSATFAHAFVWRRSRYRIAFGLSLALLVYAHNWGLFFGVGTVVALVPMWWRERDRGAFVKYVLGGYAITAILYLPWLPTLASQAAHTGAPWAERPGLSQLLASITSLTGHAASALALLLAGGAGLTTLMRGEGPAARRSETDRERLRGTGEALAVAALSALALAWVASLVSPAFSGRYLAVFVGPMLLLGAAGLASAGRLGIVAIVIVLALWFDPRTSTINHKSDARTVAARVDPFLHRGDVVVSVHPEQGPLLHYYFRPGLRWANAIGPMPDTGVFDWRDALTKLRAARPKTTLDRLVATMKPEQTLVLALPIIRTASWGAPWTSLVRKRSAQWEHAADRDPRLVREGAVPAVGAGHLPKGVRTVLYRVNG